jgi:hypothetical protein
MGRAAKRQALEQIGRELHELIEQSQGRSYTPFDDAGIRYVQDLIRRDAQRSVPGAAVRRAYEQTLRRAS